MWHQIRRGFRATLPIALGVTPFGVAYGAVAAQGMAPWQAVLMSLIVFTGTAQFIAASMLVQGVAYLPILVTGLLVNMRMVLMSAALAQHVKKAPRARQWLMAHLLTDESFAVSIAEFKQGPGDALFTIGSGLAIYVFWLVATLIGVIFGARLPEGLGLEYAMPASLICLLFLLLDDRHSVMVAILSAALSVMAYVYVSSTWNVMFATLIAVTLGVIWKQRR